jgi:ribonuclease G
MTQELFISVENGAARIAQIEDGRLTRLEAAPMGKSFAATDRLTNAIYLGQVERVVPRLQAAFVDIGLDRAGFLGAREARVLVPDADRDTPIEDCVADGDTVLVQVTRPPVGDKGAQLTADVTLPGRAVVLAPCRTRIAISRSIENETERARLAAQVAAIKEGAEGEAVDVEGMDGPAGWVIRTAADGMAASDMAADMADVAARWEKLMGDAENAEPPQALFADLGPVERALRDLVQAETTRIVIEGEAAFRLARGYMREALPEMVERLEQSDADEVLFDRHDIVDQIDKALSPRVDLPSGGWLMIETTEAMTTIDVNSAAHNGDALAVNLEAAALIGPQLRLRALGGLVAVDFIDMTDEAAHGQVLDQLATGFEGDRNQVRIGPMSEFCVVEMTRRRDAQTLAQAVQLSNKPTED